MKYPKILCLAIVFSIGHVSAQTYFLNGNAIALGGDCYQLTGLGNYENGTVWYGDQINLEEPFDLLFYMNYGSLDGNGADGICFVMQTVGTNAIGESGGGLGYLNFGTSLGIEFDTWQNTDYGDPFEDHVAIEMDGVIDHNAPQNIAGPVSLDPLGMNVEDGQEHLVRITWDPILFQLRVYYECEFRLGATIDLITEVFNGQNLVYWGFTAATGGAVNYQIVCLEENILASQDEVYTCPGFPVQLSAGAGGGTYLWSPSTGLDDPNSASPIAQIDETTTYTVQYTDPCGIQGTADVTIFVEPLIATTTETAELNCNNPTLEIQGSANFPEQFLSWDWITNDGNILNGAASSSPLVNEPGEYMYIISYEGFCADTGYVEITSDFSDFVVSISDVQLINCINESVNVSATTSPSNGVSYTWTTLDGSIISSTDLQSILVDGPGTYFVQTYLSEFCNGGESIEVFANYEVPELFIQEPAQINCYNNEVYITATTNPQALDYAWSSLDGGEIISGQGSTTISVSAGANYQVVALHPESGCPATESVEVFEDFSTPQIASLSADTLDCLHPIVSIEIQVVGAEDLSYQWTASEGANIVSGANGSGPAVDEPGVYEVLITDLDNGCSSEGDVLVVENDLFNLDLSSIEFPNVITPGADEKNREWRPFLRDDPSFDLTQVFYEYDLKIYNRWGSIVFESTDSQRSWGDREAQNGVYYYIVRYESLCGSGASEDRSGHFHLMK